MFYSPFEQFRVIYLFHSVNFYFSTVMLETLLLLLFMIFIYTIFLFYKKQNIIAYFFGELYLFVYSNLRSYIGNYTNFYFPFYYYLFLFILLSNLTGLLPYSVTLTSQLFITLSFAMISWISIFYIALSKWGIKLLGLFFPHGVSTGLVFFSVIVETISYIFRMFSLALRLFANIVAGHILIDCIVYFIYKLVYSSIYMSSINLVTILKILVPFIFLLILFFFELVVAFLQAYIFIILSALYLKEIL
jgi:F-type H+-transporting ATPase subunit a